MLTSQRIICISWNVLNSCKTFAAETGLWRQNSYCIRIGRKLNITKTEQLTGNKQFNLHTKITRIAMLIKDHHELESAVNFASYYLTTIEVVLWTGWWEMYIILILNFVQKEEQKSGIWLIRKKAEYLLNQSSIYKHNYGLIFHTGTVHKVHVHVAQVLHACWSMIGPTFKMSCDGTCTCTSQKGFSNT